MSIYKELSYDQEIDEVKGIQFSVLGPEEILKRSAVHVTKPDAYNGVEPVVGGLFDPRMGVLDHNQVCRTCEQKNIFCPGHFGHVNLARPVYHALFFDIVRKLLRCVCYRCSRIMVSPINAAPEFLEQARAIQAKKISMQKRWDAMYELCTKPKIHRCGDDGGPGCGARQPSRYQKENILRIVAIWKETDKSKAVEDINQRREMTPEEALRIFQRISVADMEALGFSPQWNRPEWMITTVMAVPPPAVRPSVTNENGMRCEDDLTHKLSDIIKANDQLQTKIDKGLPEEALANFHQLLQYHVATLLDNQIPGLPVAQQRNGRRLKSIADRLKRKEGRIRGNLNGKRVDQSARTVITPDPYISIDELGVPILIAMNQTHPETVNDYNIEEMRRLVLNGPDKFPGAKHIRKHSDGRTITLKYADKEKHSADLENGDIVDRHLRDGDYILFNRQPSLHKMSMMTHKVRVMPWKTFRLNVLAASPYNADFDGDEMNSHSSQSIQTMCELMDFTAIPYHILGPKDGKPIIGIVQDTALGMYRLTKDDVRISDKVMANLQMVNSYFDGTLPPQGEDYGYDGRDAFSMILPPGLYLQSANKQGKVQIKNGKLLAGTLDKGVYNKGLTSMVFHDYGPFETRRFLDNTQRLACRWLMTAGFSVGISDLVVDDKTKTKLTDDINKMKAGVYKKIGDVRNGKMENLSIYSNQEYFEVQISNILNEATKAGDTVLDTINDNTNRMLNMVKSGSKGSYINVAQMIACLGQQNVDSKRIPYGFTDRTLPHYTKYDDGPEARGFVESNFIGGLTPQEVFFHAMGGREGLIDTAVKTSDTGYLQRRLVKAMEDCKIYYDNTVRNATGALVQFMYGEDGMEGTKVEGQQLPYIRSTVLELEAEHLLRKEDHLQLRLTPAAWDGLDAAWPTRCREHFNKVLEDREFIITKVFKNEVNDQISFPIPFARLVNIAAQRTIEGGLDKLPTALSPSYILDAIDRLSQSLYVSHRKEALPFLDILLRAYLSPKVLIFKHHLPQSAFDWICTEVERYFKEAIAQPGEMVGIIAAQSIGEPATQLTLNTFHLSGTASASKATRGVPRLKELLSVSKNIKVPTLIIYMRPEIASNKERSAEVLNSLEISRLNNILEYTEIYWDPAGETGFDTGISADDDMIGIYRAFAEAQPVRCNATSPWVLRMELNREKMHRVGLTMMDIYMKIFNTYGNQLECMFADDNTNNLIFRIRLTDMNKDIDNDDAVAALKAVEWNIVNHMLLKGMTGINKVSMREVKLERYDQAEKAFKQKSEWVLDTDGSNLLDILADKSIDPTRTISNDIWEIYQVLGVEAARYALYMEIHEVIKESSVNYRHIAMLVDTITNRGALMPIDRHGINRGDVGPLAKSSFEETTDMLINASIFSEYDRINGVSANIMLGQLPPCGTGDSDILLDEERYIQLLKDVKHKRVRGPLESVEEAEDFDPCSGSAIGFTYEMPPALEGKLEAPKVVWV